MSTQQKRKHSAVHSASIDDHNIGDHPHSFFSQTQKKEKRDQDTNFSDAIYGHFMEVTDEVGSLASSSSAPGDKFDDKFDDKWVVMEESSTVTTSSTDKFDESWTARLHELSRYKELHGHCLVPKKSKTNPQLGIWVMNQRAQAKLLREGKPSTMSQERIEALTNLGFTWSLCDHVDWESRLEELRCYKVKFGNCLVPNKYPANPQLGTWVNKQRTQYKLMRDGKPSSMTAKRVRALENLGFVWSKRDLVDWKSRLEELRQYKSKYGDCLVPNKFSENPQLGTWVMHQRAQYRKWKEGKPSPMTLERVRALESIGFVWSISNLDVDWGARLKELEAFREAHGHCRVPNKFPDNLKLGTWVSKQRKQWKQMKEGKPSTLTPERVRTLQSLGFVWSLRNLVDWEARLEELRTYKSKHGDCLVPQQYPMNPQLGTWVSNQRKQYRLLKEGKPSPMNKERIKALENLGFVWSIFNHEDPFEAKLAELKAYRAKYGDCNVPEHFENQQLATWIKNQRAQYKLLQEGQPSAMNRERVHALESLGFIWTSGRHDWDVRQHRYQSFRPLHAPSHPGAPYPAYYEEKGPSTTAEHIGPLESLGYVCSSVFNSDAKHGHPANSSNTFTPVRERELMRSSSVLSLEDHKHQWMSQLQERRTCEVPIVSEGEMIEWEPLTQFKGDDTANDTATASASSNSSLTLSPSPQDWTELFDPIFVANSSNSSEKRLPASVAWDAHIDAMCHPKK